MLKWLGIILGITGALMCLSIIPIYIFKENVTTDVMSGIGSVGIFILIGAFFACAVGDEE